MEQQVQQVLVGADPECFLQQMTTDRINAPRWDFIPAFGLFGGDKDAPKKMGEMEDGFFYLEDNAALEFNIPPQRSSDNFCAAINNAKDWLRRNKLAVASLEFSESNVLELVDKYRRDPRGQRVGCSPDYDAYNGEGTKRDPFDANKLGNIRYAGGHIHLSYNVDAIPPYVAARFLDLYLQLPWLEYDLQHVRRTTYGQAGLFRPKQYGVEYRTPSNWWLWTSTSTLKHYVEGALYFSRRSYDGEYLRLLSEAYAYMPWADVKKVIEGEDYHTARQLVDLANRRFNLNILGDNSRPRRV